VIENLKADQEKEVRLLKRFMKMVGTYGSEFKVGGFSGYLCELLVIHYGSFLDVLQGAWNEWKPGYQIDLMNYRTANLFNDPMVVVDPTDKNRNVSAALRLQKMSEFVIAAGNFLETPKKSYFYPKVIEYNQEDILGEFNRRETQFYPYFPSPKYPF
jgi:tRNA nucleotidyltransferase (CCA-adding enzyme)